MKRFLYMILFLPCSIVAQNMYNVAPLFNNDLNGTARFIGMGGSMSALGGDASTMGTNPAGIALYRTNDLSFTAGVNSIGVEAQYEGWKRKSDRTYGTIDNVSFVLANEYDDEYLKFLNIGVGYRRNCNIEGEFAMAGPAGAFSQQYIIDKMYRNNPFNIEKLDFGMYENFAYSWLPLLMAEGYYEDYIPGDNFITDGKGLLLWAPTDIEYHSEERGGVDEVDFNISANINDYLYLGMTIGVANVDYSRYSCYYENDDHGEIYSIANDYSLTGKGFNVKLGAILRPFKYSPFKIGLAVHTPTWYDLEEIYSASITGIDGYIYDTRDEERFYDDVRVKFKLNTPWRFNTSVSYTFGSILALNAEYEYADYSSSEFKRRNNISKLQNNEIERNLEAQHTFRIGAEYNLGNYFIRTGYNYQTAPFKEEAYKNIADASVTDTSTEYMNKFEKNVVTLGAGYRYKGFYFDVAYMLQTQKADFYPFYDEDYINPAAEVKNTDHSVIATIGMRF